MKKFNEIKEEIKTKVNEKIQKEDSEMETTEKKGMPKWLKIGGAILGAGALGVGAYVIGKHNGAASEDVDDEEDYEEDLFESDEDAE